MTDLATFLRERIAEDESVVPVPDFDRRSRSGAWYSADFDVVFVEEDRWLAECRAKRRIVERHESTEVLDHREFGCTCGFGYHRRSECLACGNTTHDEGEIERPFGPCPDLRLLVLPYADHPDYRGEWRP